MDLELFLHGGKEVEEVVVEKVVVEKVVVEENPVTLPE